MLICLQKCINLRKNSLSQNKVFHSIFDSVAVDEITKNITLTVLRDQGTFCEVTVFCYTQSMTDGATQGIDYQFDPKVSF